MGEHGHGIYLDLRYIKLLGRDIESIIVDYIRGDKKYWIRQFKKPLDNIDLLGLIYNADFVYHGKLWKCDTLCVRDVVSYITQWSNGIPRHYPPVSSIAC